MHYIYLYIYILLYCVIIVIINLFVRRRALNYFLANKFEKKII